MFIHCILDCLKNKKARDPVVFTLFCQMIFSLLELYNLDPSLLQIISINNVYPPIILAPNTTLGSRVLFPCQIPPWEVMHYPLVQKLSENGDKNNQITPIHITDSRSFCHTVAFCFIPLVTACLIGCLGSCADLVVLFPCCLI